MALYNLLSARTPVKLIYIPCIEVTKYTAYVKTLDLLPTPKGTIKLHQIISVVPKKDSLQGHQLCLQVAHRRDS